MEIRTEATADGDFSVIPNGRTTRQSGVSVTFLAAAVAKTVTSSTNQGRYSIMS